MYNFYCKYHEEKNYKVIISIKNHGFRPILIRPILFQNFVVHSRFLVGSRKLLASFQGTCVNTEPTEK